MKEIPTSIPSQQSQGDKRMDVIRRNLLLAGVAAAAGSALSGCGGSALASTPLPFPDIADTSAATPQLVSLMDAYHTAKTDKNLTAYMSFFSPQMVTYFDNTLGFDMNYGALLAIMEEVTPKWPPGSMSYPTRIVGDMTSALITFTNTPGLFGGEIRAVAAVNFNSSGQIVRWIDYWDSRAWPNLYDLSRNGDTNSHADAVGETAAATLQSVASALITAFSNADATSAAAMFSYDAVYEDLVLRTQVVGNAAIQRYFSRSLASIPLGVGVSRRHVVGSNQGGGIEWIGVNAVKAGVSAILLNSSGLITRMSTMYDGTLLGSGITPLVALAIDP